MWYEGYGWFVDRIVQYAAWRRNIDDIREHADCKSGWGMKSGGKSMAGFWSDGNVRMRIVRYEASETECDGILRSSLAAVQSSR